MHGFSVIAIALIVATAIVAVTLGVSAVRRRACASRLESLAGDVSSLHDAIARLEDFESGYLMKRDWDALLETAGPVLKALSKIPQKLIEASPQAENIAFVRERCHDPSFRSRRNDGYKARELELCDALFSDVDGGKSLDSQQRDAIVTDEYSNLVIAGAGSGKTSVVVGKVKYLVERWHIDPSEILVTSFTRASVDDLKVRTITLTVKVK